MVGLSQVAPDAQIDRAEFVGALSPQPERSVSSFPCQTKNGPLWHARFRLTRGCFWPVLELIRLNRIDAPTVDLIMKRFDVLDVDGSGRLTPQETYLRAAGPQGKLELPPDWVDG